MDTRNTPEHGNGSDESEMDEIAKVIHAWMTEGDMDHPEHGIPLHPEYVYRLTGDWKGWNHLFNTTPDDQETYEEHRRLDVLEDRAWGVLVVVLANQRRRAEAKAASGEIDISVAREIITGLATWPRQE